MQSIALTFQNFRPVVSKSEKTELIKQLYYLYTSDNSKAHRKAENRARYIVWLKSKGISPTKVNALSKVNLDMFKRSKDYLLERTDKSFAIALSKHSKEVLYEILSTAKDMDANFKNTGAYLGSQFWKFT